MFFSKAQLLTCFRVDFIQLQKDSLWYWFCQDILSNRQGQGSKKVSSASLGQVEFHAGQVTFKTYGTRRMGKRAGKSPSINFIN